MDQLGKLLEQSPGDINVNQLLGRDVGYNFLGKLTRSGLGLAVSPDSGWKTLLDTWSGVDNTQDIISHAKNAKLLREAERLRTAGDFDKLAEITGKIPKSTGLSKFAGAAGIAISAGEGIYNGYQAFTADSSEDKWKYGMSTVGNVGEVMMAAAPFTGAAAPVVAGIGGVLWGANTIYQNRKQIGRGLSWAGDKIAKGYEGAKKAVKEGSKKVLGGIKKAGSWLKPW
ncbi:hypothetical protein [Paludifilum halophilum]|uniref:hypothetical protein n=1 Tax=Paludifilum halophilum TaxID=1642702 RepID=UPI001140845E|nr:hypothetical protein [Paludifilum halophilum]